MSKFIDFVNEQIKAQMLLGQAKNVLLLTGYRNLKSDFEYQISKNPKLDEIELLKKLYKSRKDNMEVYKGVREDLYNQEFTEAEILEPFIPTPPTEQEVIDYLTSLHPISRSKMNFPQYQSECVEKFGQKVDAQVIFKFIRNDY
jgi:uncharacterized protein YqeY